MNDQSAMKFITFTRCTYPFVVKGGLLMFFALNINRERVYIDDVKDNERYYCPVCKQPVLVKKEETPHFAHYQCRQYGCSDRWGYDVSLWNKRVNNCFSFNEQEKIIEFDNIEHRANVIIDKTVINFINGSLTDKEFYARTSFFINAGYRVVWVFNITTSLKNNNIILSKKDKDTYTYLWRFPMPCIPYFPKPQYQSKNVAVCFYIEGLSSGRDNSNIEVFPILWSSKDKSKKNDNVQWMFKMNINYKIILKQNMDTDQFFWSDDQWTHFEEFTEDHHV